MLARALIPVATLVAALALGTCAPVAAIETASFGLDVAEPSADDRLHIALHAGRSSTGTLVVWNKTEEPLSLRLSVAPAQVAANGGASVGGDEPAVSWVTVPDVVELGPGARRTVEVAVEAPRRLSEEVRTVAVVAEPAAAPGTTPAVVQRLAITTFLEPAHGSLVASLGGWPWVALVLLVLVGGAAGAVARRRTGSTGGAGL